MERTVPSTASEEVELYLRTYYSLLRSTADVHIRTLEEVHAGMHSLLHGGARLAAPDMSAFIYSILRLPPCLPEVQLVVLGQRLEVFQRGGYGNIEEWEQVTATARRRRCFYDGKHTLACFIASRSDIDDVIPLLTAFQIEWNKLNGLLQSQKNFDFASSQYKAGAQQTLASILQINLDDLARLRTAWGSEFSHNMETMASRRMSLHVKLLSGSLSEYRRATNQWWENIERLAPAVKDRPVYFVSSNTHSLANLLSGFALSKRLELLAFLEKSNDVSLKAEWKDIQDNRVNSSEENFLYYLLKKYQATPSGQAANEEQRLSELEHGLLRVPSEHSFDVEAQVIELKKLDVKEIDPRLCEGYTDLADLAKVLYQSEALILNIDYPLGLAAYNILAEVADQAGKVLGVYVMGKSASLNGVLGDVMIPSVVHDEHSKNTFLFSNCFSSADVLPYLKYGAVLDNQKAVSVRGTFLQNATYMDVFYREGYTDIEMEAGPYLAATYEMYRPQRHPMNEIVNLYGMPFDLGIIHYVSDTPLSKGRNLGSRNLSYYGMDSTYAATIAILRRILRQEFQRLEK
jgi:hypothetical protein